MFAASGPSTVVVRRRDRPTPDDQAGDEEAVEQPPVRLADASLSRRRISCAPSSGSRAGAGTSRRRASRAEVPSVQAAPARAGPAGARSVAARGRPLTWSCSSLGPVADQDARPCLHPARSGLERILDHPVRREVDARAQAHARVALDAQLHREPALAGALDERLEHAREARLRGQLRAIAVAPQHAQQPAHLGERVATGLLDGGERRPAACEVTRVEHARHRLGLDDHRAEPVRHERLELSRDAGALVLDRAAGALDALALGAPRPSRAAPPGAARGCGGRGRPGPGATNRNTAQKSSSGLEPVLEEDRRSACRPTSRAVATANRLSAAYRPTE